MSLSNSTLTPIEDLLTSDRLEVTYPKVRELRTGSTLFDGQELKANPSRKVFFVVPPGNVTMNYGRLYAAATELPWLGMAYVVGAVRAVGHAVHLVDYEAERLDWTRLEQDIREVKPDVIAMATFINNMDRCFRVADIAKAVDPSIKVLLGGPNATIFPQQAISHPTVDYVAGSESEISVCNLLNALDDPATLAQVSGAWWKQEGEVVQNQRQPLIDDLDSLPAPALDLYPMERYYPAVHIWGKRVANYVTSRGCPHRCTFCEAKMTFGRTFRYHSPDRVVQDLNALNDQFGFDSFQFYDDIFTTNRDRVVQLCEKMLKNDRKYRWMCYTRTDRIDPELCRLMKEAGCYLLVFGCESGSQKLLDSIKKDLSVEQNREGIEIAYESGLRSLSSFMLGLPGETPEMTQETIDFAVNSKLNYAVFPIFEPYPGTEIWNDCLESGYFIERGEYQNSLMTNFEKIWVPNGRERGELEAYATKAFRKFYLRPRIAKDWITSLAHVPPSRGLRYVWSGINYFASAARDGIRRGSRY